MKELKDKRELFSSRYSSIYGPHWLDIAESFDISSFRINTSLFTKSEILSTSSLNSNGKYNFISDTFFTFNNIDKNYVSKLSYSNGFIMNLSSFIPVNQLELKDNSNILDICAAPGVKSSQILLEAYDKNHVIQLTSCEKDQKRFQTMKTFMNNLFPSSESYQTINIDSRKLNTLTIYDEVLCDVPCSAEGEMIKDKNYSRWNSKLINSYTNTQKSILAKAISLVKSGGNVVYSTCTLSPEENEEVIDWALKRFEIELEEVKIPNFGEYTPKILKGISSWGIKNYDSQIEKSVRIVPDHIYEGFFVTVIKKK